MTTGDRSPDSASTAGRTLALGGGRRVPYPEPANTAATKIGKANRRTDTKPEVRLRSALHRRGLRFRKDFLVSVGGLRVRPDVVFTRRKLAVFVDGCFWHSCPQHGSIPNRNRGYWLPKLATNVERDRRVDAALRASGWSVERLWEHEDAMSAAHRIDAAVHSEIQETGKGRRLEQT